MGGPVRSLEGNDNSRKIMFKTKNLATMLLVGSTLIKVIKMMPAIIEGMLPNARNIKNRVFRLNSGGMVSWYSGRKGARISTIIIPDTNPADIPNL